MGARGEGGRDGSNQLPHSPTESLVDGYPNATVGRRKTLVKQLLHDPHVEVMLEPQLCTLADEYYVKKGREQPNTHALQVIFFLDLTAKDYLVAPHGDLKGYPCAWPTAACLDHNLVVFYHRFAQHLRRETTCGL